jgi:hypothetical protein
MGVHFKEKDRQLYNVTIDRELVLYSPRQQKKIFRESLSKEERFWLNVPCFLSLVEGEVQCMNSAKAELKDYFSIRLPQGVNQEGLNKVCGLFANMAESAAYPHHEFLFEVQQELTAKS